MKAWKYILVTLALAGCTSNEKEFSDVVTLDSVGTGKNVPSVGVKPSFQAMSYQKDGKTYQVDTVKCEIKGAKAIALVVNDGINAYAEDFCKSTTAAAFYSVQTDVWAINVPGTGHSSGDYDLGGPLSQEAILKVASTAGDKLHGLMGSYLGGIATAEVAKKLPSLKYIILGSTVFDLEAAYQQTSDKNLKLYVDRLAKGGDKSAVFEARSIMWDPTGMPAQILLFHGSGDTRVSSEQAKAFRDTLSTQQKSVQLAIVEGLAGPLSDSQKGGLIAKFLSGFAN